MPGGGELVCSAAGEAASNESARGDGSRKERLGQGGERRDEGRRGHEEKKKISGRRRTVRGNVEKLFSLLAFRLRGGVLVSSKTG
eukprot:563616-Hanusia_phi.AAC.1